jgi:hypothetical protein
MAISPDALPITAAATALVLRRRRLAGQAVIALVWRAHDGVRRQRHPDPRSEPLASAADRI